jgi:mono/diheme cytochrome c family protein
LAAPFAVFDEAEFFARTMSDSLSVATGSAMRSAGAVAGSVMVAGAVFSPTVLRFAAGGTAVIPAPSATLERSNKQGNSAFKRACARCRIMPISSVFAPLTS